MNPGPSTPTIAAAIIERANGEVLIARSADAGTWEFPCGPVEGDESPEAAIRRLAREMLGVSIDIDVGQPPLPGAYGGTPCTYRYFLAVIVEGDPRPVGYANICWTPKARLCEFDFDATTKQVVQWYTE